MMVGDGERFTPPFFIGSRKGLWCWWSRAWRKDDVSGSLLQIGSSAWGYLHHHDEQRVSQSRKSAKVSKGPQDGGSVRQMNKYVPELRIWFFDSLLMMEQVKGSVRASLGRQQRPVSCSFHLRSVHLLGHYEILGLEIRKEVICQIISRYWLFMLSILHHFKGINRKHNKTLAEKMRELTKHDEVT